MTANVTNKRTKRNVYDNISLAQDDAFTRSGGDASGQLPRAAGGGYDDMTLYRDMF